MDSFVLTFEKDKIVDSLNSLGDLARKEENRVPLSRWIEPISKYLAEDFEIPKENEAKALFVRIHALCYRALANFVIDNDEVRRKVYDAGVFANSVFRDILIDDCTNNPFFQKNLCGFIGNCSAGAVIELNQQLVSYVPLHSFFGVVLIQSHKNNDYLLTHLCVHAMLTFFDEDMFQNPKYSPFYVNCGQTLLPSKLSDYIKSLAERDFEEDFVETTLKEELELLNYISSWNRNVLLQQECFFKPLFEIILQYHVFSDEESEEDDEFETDEELNQSSLIARFLQDFYSSFQQDISCELLPEFHSLYGKEICSLLNRLIKNTNPNVFLIKRDTAIVSILNSIVRRSQNEELLQSSLALGFELLQIHLPTSEEVRAKLKRFKRLRCQLRVKNEERYYVELQTVGAKIVHTVLSSQNNPKETENEKDETKNERREQINSSIIKLEGEGNVLSVIENIIGTDGGKCTTNQPMMLSIIAIIHDLISKKSIPILMKWGVVTKLEAYLRNSNPVIIYSAIVVIRALLSEDPTFDAVNEICRNKNIFLQVVELGCGAKRGVVNAEKYEVKVEGEEEPENAIEGGILGMKRERENAETNTDAKPKDFRVQWESARLIARLVQIAFSENENEKKQTEEKENEESIENAKEKEKENENEKKRKEARVLIGTELLSVVIRVLCVLSVSPFSLLTTEAINALTLLLKTEEFDFSKDFTDEEIEYVKEYVSKAENENSTFVLNKMKK